MVKYWDSTLCVEKGNNRVYRTDESSWFVNPWLSVDVWPARMEFYHALHLVRDYLAFSLEVFVKHSVADRGFYVVFNFVNVFFEAKYDSGIAFVGRNECKFGSLFHQGLQSSAMFGS